MDSGTSDLSRDVSMDSHATDELGHVQFTDYRQEWPAGPLCPGCDP